MKKYKSKRLKKWNKNLVLKYKFRCFPISYLFASECNWIISMKFCFIWTRFALVKFRSAFLYASLNSSNVSLISTASAPRIVKNFANSDMVPMIIRTTQWIQYVCTNCAVRNPTGVFQSHGNLCKNSCSTFNKMAMNVYGVCFDYFTCEFCFLEIFSRKMSSWFNICRLNECGILKF